MKNKFTEALSIFMKNTLYLLFFTLFSFLSINAQNTEYYISPTGNDNNTGTLAAPFQTLERARTEIRTNDHFGPVTVWLMDLVSILYSWLLQLRKFIKR